MGDQTPNPRRFRINPVEVGIFSVVTLIFLNSVYNLFYDRQSLRSNALEPMAANPISEGRSLASTPQSFLNLDVKCEANENGNRETSASKVRITGALCGIGEKNDTSKISKTLITNSSNKYSATVFTDVSTGKYSTDYIPLTAGRNVIHVEFAFQSGKSITQDVSINKY